MRTPSTHTSEDFHRGDCSVDQLRLLTGRQARPLHSKRTEVGSRYLLAQTGMDQFRLINLDSGNRNADVCPCMSLKEFGDTEFSPMELVPVEQTDRELVDALRPEPTPSVIFDMEVCEKSVAALLSGDRASAEKILGKRVVSLIETGELPPAPTPLKLSGRMISIPLHEEDRCEEDHREEEC